MKKALIIFIAILYASTILTSCSGNEKTNSSISNENILQNTIYLWADDNNGYYFYNNDSCLYIYDGYKGVYSKPRKYKITGNTLTIEGNLKYRILGNQAILSEETFSDGEGRAPLLKSNDFAPLHKHR